MVLIMCGHIVKISVSSVKKYFYFRSKSKDGSVMTQNQLA